MTKDEIIEAAFEAGAKAAAEKAYSTFNIANEASWTTYTRHIREAMNEVLDGHGMISFTDSTGAQKAAIAQEDGFSIGIIDRSSGVSYSRMVKFSDVDLVLGDPS